MTPKQMYTELAKVAGHRCYDGKRFIESKRPGMEHIEIIQSRILAILEKLNYSRAAHDFRDSYLRMLRERQRRMESQGRSPNFVEAGEDAPEGQIRGIPPWRMSQERYTAPVVEDVRWSHISISPNMGNGLSGPFVGALSPEAMERARRQLSEMQIPVTFYDNNSEPGTPI